VCVERECVWVRGGETRCRERKRVDGRVRVVERERGMEGGWVGVERQCVCGGGESVLDVKNLRDNICMCIFIERACLSFKNYKFSTDEANHVKVEAHLASPLTSSLLLHYAHHSPIPMFCFILNYIQDVSHIHSKCIDIKEAQTINLIQYHQCTSNFR